MQKQQKINIYHLPLNIIETIFDYNPQIYWLNEVLKKEDWKQICLNEVHLDKHVVSSSFLSLVKEKPPLNIQKLCIDEFFLTSHQAFKPVHHYNFENVLKSCNPETLQDLKMTCFYFESDNSNNNNINEHFRLISDNTQIHRGLSPFIHLKKLHLNFGKEKTTNIIFQCVSYMKQLQHLHIPFCENITDDGFQLLSSSTQLTHLTLSCCSLITNKGLKWLSLLSNLQLLKIHFVTAHNITIEGLKYLHCLTKLTHLDVYCTNSDVFTDELFEVWCGSLKKLNFIEFNTNNNITSQSLIWFSSLTKLQHLNLQDYDFAEVIQHDRIKHLSYHSLKNLTHLQLLFDDDFHSLENVIEGLKHISHFEQLTDLSLSESHHITDEGISHLSNLKKLTSLELDGLPNEYSNITNKGLKYISQLTELTHLLLSSCSNTTNEGLQYLHSLKKLKYLEMMDEDGCGISEEAFLHFQKKMPECVVYTCL